MQLLIQIFEVILTSFLTLLTLKASFFEALWHFYQLLLTFIQVAHKFTGFYLPTVENWFVDQNSELQ